MKHWNAGQAVAWIAFRDLKIVRAVEEGNLCEAKFWLRPSTNPLPHHGLDLAALLAPASILYRHKMIRQARRQLSDDGSAPPWEDFENSDFWHQAWKDLPEEIRTAIFRDGVEREQRARDKLQHAVKEGLISIVLVPAPEKERGADYEAYDMDNVMVVFPSEEPSESNRPKPVSESELKDWFAEYRTPHGQRTPMNEGVYFTLSEDRAAADAYFGKPREGVTDDRIDSLRRALYGALPRGRRRKSATPQDLPIGEKPDQSGNSAGNSAEI